MTKTIGGVFPVLPTPFRDSSEIDEAGFIRIVDFVVASGVDGVVFPGLASEYDMLSLSERQRLIALVGERAAGRVDFIVGASSADAAESAALVRSGRDAGAAAAMVMTPASFIGDPAGLAAHYTELGGHGLPIMLQNAPKPMGIGLSPTEVLATLAASPVVAWVKEENMPCGQRISALLAAAPASLIGVFGGAGGRYITDELARGATGTMPAAELPEVHVALMAAHRARDDGKVRDLYDLMLPVLTMQAVFRWRLTKEILRRRGLIASAFTRAPGPEFDDGDHRELDKQLVRLEALTGPIGTGR
ncbi:dihydrodipicolinate synthase family protein [Sphingomonas sp.]|uniref:dihydrodipicolinate synthase family protein n=1 Tax=Sphingomonas sp. TaxID=28214 RepID=UPI003D6C9B9E